SPTTRILSGKIERIGLPNPTLTIKDPSKNTETQPLAAANHRAAGKFLIGWLARHAGSTTVLGIGHRVVHGGMNFTEPQRITPRLVKELRRLSPYDPEHLPSSIQLMELFAQHDAHLPQVACFDTSFHREMPRVARLLPIPRQFDAKGVQRFGF